MPTTQPGMDAYSRYIETLGYGPMTSVMQQYNLAPDGYNGMPFGDFSALLQALNYQAPQAAQAQQPYQGQGALSDALAAIQARMQGQQAGGGRPAGSYGPGLDRFRDFNPIRGGGSLYQSGPPQAPQFGAAPWLRGGQAQPQPGGQMMPRVNGGGLLNQPLGPMQRPMQGQMPPGGPRGPMRGPGPGGLSAADLEALRIMGGAPR